jgi:hypothetical protein
MKRCIKFSGGKGCGFFALLAMNRSDPGEKQARGKLNGAIYKPNAKDPGLAVNFCPFCGSRIDWFRENRNGPGR